MAYPFKKCAMAGCISMLAVGCASHQKLAPEYRLSSTSTEAIAGASMLQRGRAQLDSGLNALAIEAFRAEIRQNPENADAYNGLAIAYDRIGRPDLAQRYFETALAKEPGNARVQANLARLNGGAAAVIQLATALVEIEHEPSAIKLPLNEVAIGHVLESIVTPTVAANLQEEPAAPLIVREILHKQGVLSARLMAAPVQLATVPGAKFGNNRPFRELPSRIPTGPKPVLPPTIFPADARSSGTRLERVSLGEVRLVTIMDSPMSRAKTEQSFASFGDRLSVWLPRSMAAEQTTRVQLPEERPIMLAAIQRAQMVHVQARSQGAELKELGQFAYVFFEIDTDIVPA